MSSSPLIRDKAPFQSTENPFSSFLPELMFIILSMECTTELVADTMSIKPPDIIPSMLNPLYDHSTL